MPVYVITGVSRGIGFELLKQISEDQENLVVGLVRDRAATEKKIAAELGSRPNVHIRHADLTEYASLKQAATDTASSPFSILYLEKKMSIVFHSSGESLYQLLHYRRQS
ncbi:uncharacterized protein N7515_007615 [Penicillium bovifimosum]|uniref:Uncharacterized protein n=1 Tax=Penicillium bovifimosum TaxID=126998 RepID=A0A9W9GYC0_9EURO|nr:uncharacterized protein N7515_007615 [Penicillium bovifimosum]KAJ5131576.1 hypothetical protein N7515_007615 [Penicillium bovifimosum]